MLETLEAFVRTNFDILQYVAFFGVFAVFAILEAVAPRDRRAPNRLMRWPTNWLLTALNIVILSALPVSLLMASDYAHSNNMGLLPASAIPIEAALVLGFLIRGFFSWFTHFLNHKVPMLWALHRVHHFDTQLDTSTTVRFHPLEFVFSTPITMAGVVAFGVPPLAILVYEVLDASVTMFSHANVRLPKWVDAPLRLVIVTPDVHRVHHSTFQPETDSNYGAVLTVWDRVFGTYRSKPGDALAEQDNGLTDVRDWRATSLLWLLISPFFTPRAGL